MGSWSFAANLQALREADIHEPAASRVARLPYVTPEYVRAHVKRVREERQALGAAIHRMEHHWPLPKPAASTDPKAEGNAEAERGVIVSAPLGVSPTGAGVFRPRRRPSTDPVPAPVDPKGPPEDPTVWNFDANLRALLEWRGAELVAERLAALKHVTPHFVREHYRQAYEQNLDVNIALYRIENNELLPELWIHNPGGYEAVKAGIDELVARLSGAHERRKDDSTADEHR